MDWSGASAIDLSPRSIDLCDKDCYRRIGLATSVGIMQASASGASDPDFAALNPGYDSPTSQPGCEASRCCRASGRSG
jgi:hypothetical protein